MPSAFRRLRTSKIRFTSAAARAEVASSRMRTRGLRASAFAISMTCRRDSGKSLTSAMGWMSSPPARASAASASNRCALRSIMPKRRGGFETMMLSATDRSGISDSSWKTLTIPAALAAAGSGKLASRPASNIRPVSGATTPAIILIRVDLPAPFSPRMACTRPAWTSRSAFSSARTPPYRLDSPSI